MSSIEKWNRYYKEMFLVWQSEFFNKLWGDYLDEYGEEYEEVYKWELEDRRESFSGFMCLFNIYNIPYERNAIAMHILDLFESLGKCDNPDGAFEMADKVIHAINIELGFNSIKCPICRIEGNDGVKYCCHCTNFLRANLSTGQSYCLCRKDKHKVISEQSNICEGFKGR